MAVFIKDIKKVKGNFIADVKRPVLAPVVVPEVEQRQPTDEDIIYSQMVEKNPAVSSLINLFDLVSTTTGERLIITEQRQEVQPQQEPIERKKQSLADIVKKIIEPQNNYTKEAIIARLVEDTKAAIDRAENGFNLMLSQGLIEETTIQGRYNLTGSTPF